ncbi:MAG TPA: AbrB/MazE/SpoVT family DNA-binding domain-containing protein [Patescibacteria group bacterium]|nr:AbrB/MazE/SpoVT family DNA-binding domain-containing protein [Patescibacteria group bacterium]
MTYILDIRQRRQVTLPGELLAGLGLNQGDQLAVTLKGDQAVIKAKKQAALDALEQIQKAFADSGIKEEELQTEAIKQRKRLAKEIKWV